MLTDEEIFKFSLACVKSVNISIHLIEYVRGGTGIGREFDLTNYELSELMRTTADLLDGFHVEDRNKYIDKLDSLLFFISDFDGNSRSVKGYMKDLISKEMRKWLRITTKRQLDR